MGIIQMIIVGLIAGLLARAIKPGADSMGWIMTIILGILGSIVGGFIASALGVNAENGMISWVFMIGGAIILLFIYELATGKRRIGR